MGVDQPKPVRVVRVPDAKQFARPRFFRNQLGPLLVSIAKHKFQRVDVPLEQPAQRQAARTNRAQDLAKGQARQPCPSALYGQDGGEEARFVKRSDIRGRISAILIIVGGACECLFPDFSSSPLQKAAPDRRAVVRKRDDLG